MAEKEILDAYADMKDTAFRQDNIPPTLHQESAAIAILTVGNLLIGAVKSGFKGLYRSIAVNR